MSAAFVGKWKLASQEHIDDYMQAIGVNMAVRLVAKLASPTVAFEINGDTWTMTGSGTGFSKDHVAHFKLGVEHDAETADGRKVKALYNLDGNKLVLKERWDGKETTVIREPKGNEIHVTMEIGNVKASRVYKRV